MESLYDLCLKLMAKLVDDNSIDCSSIQELPTLLLKDLAPKLSPYGLSRLHRILQERGIGVQRYWMALCTGAFYQDKLGRQCCLDQNPEITDWRQRFLDGLCQQQLGNLKHCEHIHQQDIQSREFLEILQNPLPSYPEDYNPSSLSLQSCLLPYIKRSEKALPILQRNLKKLVLSDYLPKYELILREILKHLINFGVLRKFTLKHPKCLTPSKLFSILEVCAGGCCHDNGRPVEHCIQHLVLYGVMLDQPDYSMIFRKVLSGWPGLRELEFIDNQITRDSCEKILRALVSSQKHTQSLQRLSIVSNSITDDNLPILAELLLSSTNLDQLELDRTDLTSLVSREALSKLTALNVSQNMVFLGVLERPLMQPAIVLMHLDLKSCGLDTIMLDRLFISAKDINCLRELHVGYNKYRPCGYEKDHSTNGRPVAITGLVELVQSSQITTLDLTSCHFKLKGWTHGQHFVDALQRNSSLRQLVLTSNSLTDECLRLLVGAFICPPAHANRQTPSRCLDLSNNTKVTPAGLREFSVALRRASISSDLKIKPHQHLSISMRNDPETAAVCSDLRQLLMLTVRDADTQSEADHRFHPMSYEDFLYE